MTGSQIISYIDKMGISLSNEQAERFVRYYELLIEWNSFMNLTAITEEEEVLSKHFADSLALWKLPHFRKLLSGSGISAGETAASSNTDPVPEKTGSGAAVRLLDIGTGAGFPAIPLKIAFPMLQVTMIDSLNKRVKFLNEVISQLKLTGICALHGRAEDFAKDVAHREQYDLVVSRAVANLSTLSEYCLPYVKVSGYFVSYKSIEAITGAEAADAVRKDTDTKKEAVSEEAVSEKPKQRNNISENEFSAASKAIKLLGGTSQETVTYLLPDTDITHCLLPIRKSSPTPKKYPRKAGLPAKEPLT